MLDQIHRQILRTLPETSKDPTRAFTRSWVIKLLCFQLPDLLCKFLHSFLIVVLISLIKSIVQLINSWHSSHLAGIFDLVAVYAVLGFPWLGVDLVDQIEPGLGEEPD